MIFKDLANTNSAVARKLIPLVPVYGRWDDLWCLEKTPVWDTVISVVKEQLASDLAGANAKAPVSLLAKWLPSLYTSSEETCRLARVMANDLKMRPEEYNAALGTLRSYLKIVEKLMSRGEWDKIDYKAVPSKANVLYNAAFLRHDEARRRAFLEAVEKGETKINASALFPYEIVAKIQEGKSDKRALEAMWKALPDTVKGNDSTIVVADGSGSMCQYIGNTSVLALNACHSLAIYFAERCSGDFKDKYITFSANPKIVDLSGVSTLREKLRIAHSHSDMTNTNIEKVFALLLRTAKEHNTNPQDMPKNILILSD